MKRENEVAMFAKQNEQGNEIRGAGRNTREEEHDYWQLKGEYDDIKQDYGLLSKLNNYLKTAKNANIKHVLKYHKNAFNIITDNKSISISDLKNRVRKVTTETKLDLNSVENEMYKLKDN